VSDTGLLSTGLRPPEVHPKKDVLKRIPKSAVSLESPIFGAVTRCSIGSLIRMARYRDLAFGGKDYYHY
jgi:hypothetical protein